MNSVPEFSASKRSYRSEIMDSLEFDRIEYRKALDQIEIINQWTLGYAPTIKAVSRLVDLARLKQFNRPIRILDIGFGGGDTLRVIAAWAKQKGVSVELTGVDLNPWAKDVAESKTSESHSIRFISKNAFELSPDESYDIILNALFMHHLNDEEIIRMLRWMSTHAKLGWFINDLHRSQIAYSFIKVATRLAGACNMVKKDAPLSVARSFTKSDWFNYIERAKIDRAQTEVKWHISFRYGVFWSRP